jgi:hypothetical protein
MLRSYDPQIGRFLQNDPYDEFASGYAGMGNDPGNNVDPTGGIVPQGMGAVGAFMKNINRLLAAGAPTLSTISTATTVASGGGNLIGSVLSLLNTANNVVNTIGQQQGNFGQAGNREDLNFGFAGKDDIAFEDEDDSDIGWSPLYKDDLKRYYKEVHGREGTENELGNEFEFEFENWVNQDIIRRLETRIRKYPGPTVNTGGDRNTKPDFVGDALIHSGKAKRRLQMADWWELKQKNGGLYLSSDEGQLRGHIDNLRGSTQSFYTRYGRLGFRAKMYVATTADVKFSPSASRYAKKNQVLYEHVHAEYRIVNGSWQFRFTKTISR